MVGIFCLVVFFRLFLGFAPFFVREGGKSLACVWFGVFFQIRTQYFWFQSTRVNLEFVFLYFSVSLFEHQTPPPKICYSYISNWDNYQS